MAWVFFFSGVAGVGWTSVGKVCLGRGVFGGCSWKGLSFAGGQRVELIVAFSGEDAAGRGLFFSGVSVLFCVRWVGGFDLFRGYIFV